jgi:DNA-binding transcriptional LysR family regulator
MELRHLRYFLIAAEEENFHRAAERLHVAQPALSRRIRDLETELGVDLFIRHQKRVRLSPVGRAYYEDAKRMLNELEQAGKRAVRAAKGELGTLSIALNDSVVRNPVIAQSLNLFAKNFQGIQLKLDPMGATSLVDSVLEEKVDAAFVYSRPVDNNLLDHIEIATDEYVVAFPRGHALEKLKHIQIDNLRDEKFLWIPRAIAPKLHDRMISAFQSRGITPNIVQYAASESTRLHLVSAGMGITLVTASIEGNIPNVLTRPVEGLSIELMLDFVWRKDRRSPILDRFIEVIHTLKPKARSPRPRRTKY